MHFCETRSSISALGQKFVSEQQRKISKDTALVAAQSFRPSCSMSVTLQNTSLKVVYVDVWRKNTEIY